MGGDQFFSLAPVTDDPIGVPSHQVDSAKEKYQWIDGVCAEALTPALNGF